MYTVKVGRQQRSHTERRFPAELVQIRWHGFGPVPVECYAALVMCVMAVRASGALVDRADRPESGGGQKVVKETWANIREDDLILGCKAH